MVRLLIKVAIGTVAAAVFFTYLVFERPLARDGVRNADAVIVLEAGDHGRLATGQHLMYRHVAPVLVIIDGHRDADSAAARVCDRHHAFVVLCPKPRGGGAESVARLIGKLTRARKWNRIVIVTVQYDMRRQRLLVNRCTKAHVFAYSTEVAFWSSDTWFGAYAEWGAMTHAQLWRHC